MIRRLTILLLIVGCDYAPTDHTHDTEHTHEHSHDEYEHTHEHEHDTEHTHDGVCVEYTDMTIGEDRYVCYLDGNQKDCLRLDNVHNTDTYSWITDLSCEGFCALQDTLGYMCWIVSDIDN